MDDILAWFCKMKLLGLDFNYKVDNVKIYVNSSSKPDHTYNKVIVPEGIFSFCCDFSCNVLVLPKSCKFLSCDSNARIKSVICESENLTIKSYGFNSNTYLESFECNNIDIKSSAFLNCKNLKTFICNDVHVHSSAFSGCVNLSVFKHNRIFMLDDYCFENCKNLDFDFSNLYCDFIGSYAFCGCNNIKTVDLYYRNNLILCNSCFYGCQSLTYVKLSKVTELHSNVFTSCLNLASVDMYKIVVYDCGGVAISTNVFYNCKSLDKIIISIEDYNNLCYDLQKFTSNSVTSSEALKQLGIKYLGVYCEDKPFDSKIVFRDKEL